MRMGYILNSCQMKDVDLIAGQSTNHSMLSAVFVTGVLV